VHLCLGVAARTEGSGYRFHTRLRGLDYKTPDAPSESKDPLEGEVIPLAQNITGYFTDYTCNANCSYPRLIWDQDGYRYYLGIKAGKLETLVKLANSAIENPALDLFPDTSRLSDCFR